MSRGVEKKFLSIALDKIKEPWKICGEYIKSPKNSPVESMYKEFGFAEKDNMWLFDRSKKKLEEVEWIKVQNG